MRSVGQDKVQPNTTCQCDTLITLSSHYISPTTRSCPHWYKMCNSHPRNASYCRKSDVFYGTCCKVICT